MRWKSGRRSTNVEDRRGSRVSKGVSVGGGVILLALLASLLLGEDPNKIIAEIAGSGQGQSQQAPAQNDEASQFVSVVLADTEDVWGEIFNASGQRYPAPTLVLFTDAVQSACGYNSAATGPFYCPGDQKVYLDLGFLNELRKLGAPGDFAFAYVIAHEVGHHIQTITGVSSQVRQLKSRASRTQANQLSVLQELQADCYAGMWARRAHEARNILEDGDVEEGLRAAASIGDDRLQRMAGRRIQPEAFTHGTSEQRVFWFRKGLQSGSYNECDTFADAGL
ncbi:MAG: flagellar biosynthesis protein FlgM [Rhodothermales bacterium]|nr:flagellar biosynthesis protein FlgM [Rhodothermales bacterium]